jgi:hypothetical protein
MKYSEGRMFADWKDIYGITRLWQLSRRTGNIPCFFTAFSVTYVSFVFGEAAIKHQVFYESSKYT